MDKKNGKKRYLTGTDKLCSARKGRENSWKLFHRKIKYIMKIFDETDENMGPTLLNELNKLQLTSLVTAMEVYFRERFIELFTVDKIDPDSVLKDINYGGTLFEVFELVDIMKNKGWKKEELVAENYNFQNLKSIDNAFQKALGERLWNGLKGYKFELDNGEIITYDKNFYPKINKIIDLRHSIIHDINFNKKISDIGFIKYYDQIHEFIDLVDIYIDEIVEKIKKKNSVYSSM